MFHGSNPFRWRSTVQHLDYKVRHDALGFVNGGSADFSKVYSKWKYQK